jgi:DNA-binding XRE family transcriptional regulator
MVTELIERLRGALKTPGFTKRHLAQVAGLHPNTLLGCESDDWNPTANTLRAIEPHLPAIERQDAA